MLGDAIDKIATFGNEEYWETCVCGSINGVLNSFTIINSVDNWKANKDFVDSYAEQMADLFLALDALSVTSGLDALIAKKIKNRLSDLGLVVES